MRTGGPLAHNDLRARSPRWAYDRGRGVPMFERLRTELLVALLIVLGLATFQWLSPGPSAREALELPQSTQTDESGALYRIHFASNQRGQPEASCTRPMCRALLSEIKRARHSIDFAVYGVRAQPAIVNALIAAKVRGVEVRGVVDTENADCSAFEYSDTVSLLDLFGRAQIGCDRGHSSRHIMHNKFFVFDRTRVWTGSTNISDSELGGEQHANVAVVFRSRPLAAAYTIELEEMLSGRFHRDKTDNTPHHINFAGMSIESYFSPTDRAIENAVLPLVAGAKHSLDIAMFYFTSRRIADRILEAHARGVTVRMLLDATGAGSRASQHRLLCANGIPVRVETWPGKSHSKWAVADANTPSAAVVFGSMNWTESGDKRNDENTLYIKSRAFAAPFQTEFERQWTDLADVPPCANVPTTAVAELEE